MGYILEKMMKGEENFERCNDFLVPVLSYTVRGLKEGKQYQFRVKAENAAGVSDPSRSTPMVKISDAVGMCIKLNLNMISTTLMLSTLWVPLTLRHYGLIYTI